MTDSQLIILSVDGLVVLGAVAVSRGWVKGSLNLKLVPPWERRAAEPRAANGQARPDGDGKVPLREAS